MPADDHSGRGPGPVSYTHLDVYKRQPEAKRDPAAIELSVKRSNDRARILDQALQGREFIAGRHLTIGDIALVCSAHRWLALPIERPDTPALSAWYRRVMMRPAPQGVLTLPLE